ncbi:hypothetical protein [Pseudoramibacter sp.]|jgi:hypothetical protein|uniref:hypothetical protein n=1 Tax=Pseudoramibacter sp. TaxID=2034862 RepID=UPI0025F22BE9|nr:hypothetical protein [Pseudoramibacter sp.]MCH4071418.1 hypothetical protein [Pseudoramibacter sp.]MCH4105186.1 hypothetical protein [Pseudoramibacter sp.]
MLYLIRIVYSGCFSNFESRAERWAYWSRWAWFNRFEAIPKPTLQHLKALLTSKDYFVMHDYFFSNSTPTTTSP